MNRSLIICATVPLALALNACTPDAGNEGTADDETGIDTLTSVGGDGDGDTTGDGDGEPTGDGDGDTAGDGDGDPTGGPSCGDVSIAPEYKPPNVMLVLDASGSMTQNSWDHDLDVGTPDETRWATLYGVVQTVMGQFGPAMRAGVQRFPSADVCPLGLGNCYNEDACIVGATPEVTVGLDNGAAILAAIPGVDGVGINGGTPATHGINSAVSHLVAQPADIARYILLVTDGAANCTPGAVGPDDALETYDETLEPTVQAAYDDDGITTFVVGIDIINALVGQNNDGAPEANPYERLNDVALAGGAPKNMGADPEKFFQATNQDELLMALALIIEDITECTIDLSTTEEGVPDASQIEYVTFTANGEDIPFVTDCENEDGWAWLETGVVVTFCGTFCDDFKSGDTVFDGVYGCPPPE